MKYKIHTFRGHSNWVKNIEYSPEQGVLLTSGFDGCIYSWNINRYVTLTLLCDSNDEQICSILPR